MKNYENKSVQRSIVLKIKKITRLWTYRLYSDNVTHFDRNTRKCQKYVRLNCDYCRLTL